jgi:hypothetical protein
MPPLFVNKALRKTIDRILPTRHHERLRRYFQTYGCMRCSQKNMIYGANGFCLNCISAIGKRLKKIDATLRVSRPLDTQDEEFRADYLRPYTSARDLLADLVPRTRKPESKLPATIHLKS